MQKKEQYLKSIQEIDAILEKENNMIVKMATINCILKQNLSYYFWVGFYCVSNGALLIGPYQGTIGCLHIRFDRGVCGRAARLRTTQIVANVHNDPEHIACDSRSVSEIVVPVFDNKGELIAVFDVDSTEIASFDEEDKMFLETILTKHFSTSSLIKQY